VGPINFLDLPRELRDMIYDHAVCSPHHRPILLMKGRKAGGWAQPAIT
jgi:hypothetical protein